MIPTTSLHIFWACPVCCVVVQSYWVVQVNKEVSVNYSLILAQLNTTDVFFSLASPLQKLAQTLHTACTPES